MVVAALLVPAAPARAKERTPIQPLGITQLGGDLLISGNMQTQSQTAPDKTVTTESEQFFDETLSINSAGYIYHPNLLEWFGGIRGGLVQQSITVNNQTTVGPGQIKGYNISGLFLREKPVSVMLFSSDMRSFINRDFASSTDLKSTRNGGQIMLKGDVPMTLMFEKVTMDENSGLRTDLRTTRHIKYTASQQRFKDAQIDFFYDHEETDEAVTFRPSQGGQQITDRLPYVRDEANLMSLTKFGPAEHQSTLGLHGRTMQRLDTFPERVRSGDLNLDLAHTKSFSTFYRASYSEDQTDADQERNVNGSVGFNQQVYDSLNITGRVDGQKYQFSDGMRTQKGEFLSLDYQKKTPIGRYSSSLMLGVQDTSEQTKNGEERIRGELVTMVGFLTFVPLSGRNIIPGSVVVQNEPRTITYVLGVDYNLQTIGQTTSIDPLPGGFIGPAQKILVDYTVTAAKLATWRTNFSTWNNRLQLPEGIPIAIYYNFNRQADHLTSGDDPGNLDIQTGRLGGAQFEQWGLTLTGEHETRDMKLSPPTTANRARVQYLAHIARDVDLSLGGTDEHLMYRNAQQFGMLPGRDRLYTLQGFARATFRLQRNLLFHMDAEYDKTQGLENRILKHVGVGVEWSYRDLEINVEVKQSDYVQEKTSGQSQTLLFSVRRRF
jgi:hypothetical protein